MEVSEKDFVVITGGPIMAKRCNPTYVIATVVRDKERRRQMLIQMSWPIGSERKLSNEQTYHNANENLFSTFQLS